MEELSYNFRILKKMNKLTRKELACKLNVSINVIRHWEKGDSEPSLKQLISIAKLFNITVDDLLF